MKHRNQKRQVYLAPQSTLADVLFEQALLTESVRVRFYLDELENINATAGDGADSDMYFEF